MPDPEHTLPVYLTHDEATLIFQTYEQVPLPGPDAKRVAANVQAKLGAMDYSLPVATEDPSEDE
jgi:hypothetical protein